MNNDFGSNNDDRTIIQAGEFYVTDLPVELQQQSTTESITEHFRKLREKLLNDSIVVEDRPLTTDVIGRGYPITAMELETIKKINDYEDRLRKTDPQISPLNGDNSRYFIIEDGRVFKCVDGFNYYGLDLDTMEWESDQTYMDFFYGAYLKNSELRNFRDYYSEKKTVKKDSGLGL